MTQFHNPQNLEPEQFGGPDGYRLLTVEEMAVLSDRLSLKTAVGQNLLRHLAPQFWSESAARWINVDLQGAGSLITTTVTLRTTAGLIEKDARMDFASPTTQAAMADFVESFNYLSSFHHQIMLAKGFWNSEQEVDAFLRKHGRDDLAGYVRNAYDGQKLALQTTEVSECVEAIRHGNPPDDKVPQFSGAEAELADVILRLMDHAFARGWNVAAAMVAKMQMNATREVMHGGKQF